MERERLGGQGYQGNQSILTLTTTIPGLQIEMESTILRATAEVERSDVDISQIGYGYHYHCRLDLPPDIRAAGSR